MGSARTHRRETTKSPGTSNSLDRSQSSGLAFWQLRPAAHHIDDQPVDYRNAPYPLRKHTAFAKDQVVESTSHQLQDSIGSANKHRQLAIDSLDNLINSPCKPNYLKHPGTLQTREAILESALQSLETLEITPEVRPRCFGRTPRIHSNSILDEFLPTYARDKFSKRSGVRDEALASIQSSVQFAQSLSVRNQHNGSVSYQKIKEFVRRSIERTGRIYQSERGTSEALKHLFVTLRTMQEELCKGFPGGPKNFKKIWR